MMSDFKMRPAKSGTFASTKGPPGRIKIASALRKLLETKDFNSITTSEISNESGVNESLIYRYFGDKRGLLHQVLREHLDDFVRQVSQEMSGTGGALEKLSRMIRASINFYDGDRVFSKMLLIEARNYPGYFESETYLKIKEYTNLILSAIQKGVAEKEIRDDISPKFIRQILLGAIEHMVLPALINNGDIDAEQFQNEISRVIFDGIRRRGEA